MKHTWFLILITLSTEGAAQLPSNLVIGDSLQEEVVLPYRERNGLIIVPVLLNDSLKANILLDPHCKTVILFGKRYVKWLRERRKNSSVDLPAQSSRNLVPDNKIAIGPATRNHVSIVVVGNRNPLNFFTSVHGIMGYDILNNYQISFDQRKQTMTIRPAGKDDAFSGLNKPRPVQVH